MYVLKSSLIVGTSAVIAWVLATYPGDLTYGFLRDAGASAPGGIVASVNRTQKRDRMPVAAAPRAPGRTISTVEFVGLRDAAIIYRDRDGRVLFQSDPLKNFTMVSKGVVLPEIIMRETAGAPARVVPVPAAASTRPRPAVSSQESPVPAKAQKKPRIPEGCDPAASPIAAPQLSHLLSKCIVQAPAPTKLAALS